ncbi:MAG TPA: AraC family transcriptional regulator [Reyranella sp.]|jgi:AraC-like DNA-binding protein
MVTQVLSGERLRAGAFMALPKVLARFDLAIEPILADLGLPPDLLSAPDNTFEVEQAGRLLELCASRSGCSHIGLLLGQAVSPAVLGLPGLLMRTADTLGEALKSLVMSLHFNGRGVIPTLSVYEETVVFGFTLTTGAGTGRPMGQDLSLAVCCQVIRSLMGSDWVPGEARLARHVPADQRPYRRCFGIDVTFDAERSVLIFPAHWLERPVATADRAAHRRLERLLATPASSDAEFVLFCRRAIIASVAQQDLSVGRVAAAMKLHPRTLNRRLALLETSIAVLVRDVRFAMARQLLTDTSLPIGEIASALGYSEASTFARNFRSWAGKPPSAWRQGNVTDHSRTTAADIRDPGRQPMP